MWPTWPMVGFSAASPVSTRLPPWRPATQCSPSRAWLSAKIRSTLTCRIMPAPARSSPRAPTARTPRAIRRRRRERPRLSRKRASENICASSERSCRCCSVACSGTSSTNTWATGLPSGASNGMGDLRRTNAPCASPRPRMRPWGIAMPWPRPVEPSFSRASRLSTTIFFDRPRFASNSAPTASNRRAFEPASRSSRIFPAGSRDAIWLIGAGSHYVRKCERMAWGESALNPARSRARAARPESRRPPAPRRSRA